MLLLLVAVPLVSVFVVLAALHFYWAAGGQWGAAAAVPEIARAPAFRPGKLATVIVGLLLATAGGLLAVGAGFFAIDALPAWIARSGVWTIAAVMLARFVGDFRTFGVMKRVKGTRFARLDTVLYAPLCLALSMGSTFVALTK